MVLECNRDASLMLDIIASTIKVDTWDQMDEVLARLCGLLPEDPVELRSMVRPKVASLPPQACKLATL